MYWNVFKWAKEVAFKPDKNTKKDYDYGEFVKRLVIVSLLPGIAATIITIAVFSTVLTSEFSGVAWASAFVAIPTYIISAIISPFIGAAVVHFFGKIIFRLMKGDFKKTFNASAYSTTASLLFMWIPVIGGILSIIWGIIVGTYALSNQQKITRGRALLVIFIPIIIFLILMGIAVAVAASFVAGALVGSDILDVLSSISAA